MIKINLVTRKQVATAKAGDGGAASIQSFLAGFKSDGRLDGLKELPFRKIGLAIVTCFVASYLSDNYKEDELAKVEVQLTQARDEQNKVRLQLAKSKGFEEIKAALDADELTLRGKIDTISKLLEALKDPPKMMMSLSASIPQNVWLSNLRIKDKEVVLKGQCIGFPLISDFMKALGESAYFTDLKLVGTQKVSESGPDVVGFDLEATKR